MPLKIVLEVDNRSMEHKFFEIGLTLSKLAYAEFSQVSITINELASRSNALNANKPAKVKMN